MKYKRWAVFALFTTLALSLFGCKRQILDGPGMVNDQPWKAFTLSHTDSQYNFMFTVEQGDFAFLLTGQYRNADGEPYTIKEGIEISAEDLQYLRDLWLGDLPNAEPQEDDGQNVTLVLTGMDGKAQEKALPQDISIQIYQRFLPYFTKI